MVLKIGTDCSGIEAPIEALRQMKVVHKQVWSCEIEKYVLPMLKANSKHEIFYEDMTKRDYNKLPKINMYVCGFPCQPFSIANTQRYEKHAKDNIFTYCLKTIKSAKPEIFVLENVKGLIMGKMKKTFDTIMRKLKALKVYDIQWKLMNTADYGVPQSRPRLYIVGIKKSVMKKEFKFPEPFPLKKSFKSCLKKGSHKKIPLTPLMRKRIGSKKDHLVDIHYLRHPQEQFWSKGRLQEKISPCIVKSSQGIFYTKENRILNIRELLCLHGFSGKFKIPKEMSESQLRKVAGNTMSVNVLKVIFKEIFASVNMNKFE